MNEIDNKNKQYFFLSGLPRSGNTLLSAILNQNPQIYSSPLSPVVSMLWDNNSLYEKEQSVIMLENKQPVMNVGKNIIINYYQDVKKPIIIDREKGWGVPLNLNILKKYITTTPKIIFTVRPVLEILASWINLLPEHSFLDEEMEANNWWYKDYLTKNDNRCDYLMHPNGQINKVLLSINEIIKPENKDVFCLIKYNNLMDAPQETMNKIYNFLELPSYEHNFNEIKQLEKDINVIPTQVDNLHEIRPILKKTSKNPEDLLSKYVIDKYSNIGCDLL